MKCHSQSYFATNDRSIGRSVSQYVLVLSPSGTHDQILAVVKTVAVLFVGRTGLLCNRSEPLSVLASTF
jgi:hypothetical protein